MKKEDIGYNRIGDWMSRYGVLEKITRSYGEDNVLSKGRKSSVSVRKKPGLSPMVFCNHLLGKCAFLHLSDIALDLPPITEQVIQVSMDPDLEAAYRDVEMELYEAVREALRKGSKALLGTYLNTLLCYPDRPFDNKPIYQNVLHFNGEVEERLITIPPELPKGKTYQKESHLIDLIKNEKRLRRKCFVFCQYTGTKDITARMKDFLGKEGIEAEVLRSSVSPEKREEWVANKVKQGVDCIIANPKLVETGLDLLDFPTLIFFQTGYSIFTLRQASRRSWRIGQNREVKVYYFFYEGTMQERAMQLMGSKLEASLAIEGKFSDEGLLAMTQGEDMTTLMAKALVDGLQVEGAEQIWKKINEANQKTVSVEMPEELDEGPLKDKEQFSFEGMEEKVVYVDFITFRGRRKNVEKLAVNADELDEVIKGKDVGSAQLALFG